MKAETQNEIRFEQMTLADKPALLTFLRETYADNPRQSDERFWNWHFPENPYASAENIPVWLAKSGERIAGQLAAIPVNLQIGGEQKRAIWILDFIVHEDFRRRGIGKKLVLKAEEFCPIGLGVNTNEQHAPALLQSLGWRIVGKINRYSKIIYPGNALREISGVNFLRDTLNALSAPFQPSRTEVLSENKNVRLLENFGGEFDEFWHSAAAQGNCAIAREAKFLNWQYVRQPGKKFEILGYFENDKLVGYAVMFFRQPNRSGVIEKAAITDFCYGSAQPEKTIDALLNAAIRLAVRRKIGSLVTDAIDEKIEAGLRRANFWSVKNPLQLMVKSDTKQDLIYERENWFLTRGDSDISIFEHPNI